MADFEGPIATEQEFYLPPGYYPISYPRVESSTTHTINSNQFIQVTLGGGPITVGLHDDFAKSSTSRMAWKDLADKGTLLDYLDHGTELVVLREAVGFEGQWTEVLVKSPNGGFNVYSEEPINLYVRSEFVERVETEGLIRSVSHPIVSPENIQVPQQILLPSNWRNMAPLIPRFDGRTAQYMVVVERETNDGPFVDRSIEEHMERARDKGVETIFEYYKKDGPTYDDNLDLYFLFARAEEYHIDPRPNAPLKILVTIPQTYFDTYPATEAARPLASGFRDATQEIENNVNKYLDRQNGQLKTDAIRQLIEEYGEEYIRENFGTNPVNITIAGEEFVIFEEDFLAEAILDPEAAAQRAQDRIDSFNEGVGDLPETLYNRFIDEDTRETISNTIDSITGAYSDAQDFANNTTAGLQNTIDTINTITDTLENAPDFESVNDALLGALSDPTVDLTDLSSELDRGISNIEADRRRALDRDLDTQLNRLPENTLLKKVYNKRLERIREIEQFGTPVDSVTQDLEELEFTIKKVDFYASFNTSELKENTVELEKILQAFENEKDRFQGDVEGWFPQTDSVRIKEAYTQIVDYITDQGATLTPKIIYQEEEYTDDLYTIADIEFAFTRNWRLIYIGYEYFDTASGKYYSIHRYGDSFEDQMSYRAPLDSKTIMAYLWKLNDIVFDPMSRYDARVTIPGGAMPLTKWGRKYVHPRPVFRPKPRQVSDISAEARKNKTILNKLAFKEEKSHRENAEIVARSLTAAVNYVEEPVDNAIAYANRGVGFVNRTDDAINNFVDAHTPNNPYSAALVKCLVPSLDFDFLPEIPDLDLQWLRNPILKALELYNLITPPGNLLEGIAAAITYAIEQALKVAYVTAIKLLLETLTATCLQIQAGLLNAIAAGAEYSLSQLLGGDIADDLALSDVSISSPESIRNAAMARSFQSIGLFPLQGYNEIDSLEKLRAFVMDVSSMLTAVEICVLTSGNPPPHIIELIRNMVEVKHPHFSETLSSRSAIVELFTAFGRFIDVKICDEIITQNENNTIYNTNYNDIYCNISSELDEARKKLLSCNSSITPEMIDDIIARENANNLVIINSLVEGIDSENFSGLLQPQNIQNEAVDYANSLAVESVFIPANETLKRELDQYTEFMKKVAELSLPDNPPLPYNATPHEVMMGTRRFEELMRPTEIAKFLRDQYNNIETNEVFQVIDDANGFGLRLRSPGTLGINRAYNFKSQEFNFENNKTFYLTYKTYKSDVPQSQPAANELIQAATSEQVEGISILPSEIEIRGQDKYSILVNDSETDELIFSYTENIEPSGLIKNYIEQNFSSTDLSTIVTTPQQQYFSEFMMSKIFGPNVDLQSVPMFLKYGVYSQVTRDVVSYLGRNIADSKYFEYNKEDIAKTNLEILKLSSYDLLGLETIKAEALKKIKKNKSKDLPEPADATIQRTNYNAFEVANIEQIIRAIINVYIVEYFVKGIFSNSVFKLSEAGEQMLFDYVLKKIQVDLPVQFSTIFNYKFFYLAKGIHQDNLEDTPFTARDMQVEYIIRKQIEEQYKILFETFNLALENDNQVEQVEQVEQLESNFDDAPMQANVGIGVPAPTIVAGYNSTAVNKFLDQLPVKDARKSYDSIVEFIGQAPETVDDTVSGLYSNGNFYFEKYINVSYTDGTNEILSPPEFRQKLDDIYNPEIETSYNPGTDNQQTLLTIGNIAKNWVRDEIAIGHSGVYMNTGTLSIYLSDLILYGATQEDVDNLVDASKDVNNNYRNQRSTYEEWAEQVDVLVQSLNQQFITGENIGGYNNILSVSHGLKLMYLFPYGNLKEKGVTVQIPNGGVDEDNKYTIDLEEAIQEDSARIKIRAGEAVESFKDHVHAILLLSNEALYTSEIQTLLIPTQTYSNEIYEMLRRRMNTNVELGFLFDYVFPIEKYKNLMSIYSVESMGDVPGLKIMFSETKAHLRTAFNVMDSRGRYQYSDKNITKFITKIQEQKSEIIAPIYNFDDVFGDVMVPDSELVDFEEPAINAFTAIPAPDDEE